MKMICLFLLCFLNMGLHAQITLVHPKYMEGNTYAVLIGVSDYVEDALDLSVADKDAIAVNHWLTTKGFPPLTADRIRVLTNRNATKANILAALRWYAMLAGEKDRIIVFFSGHGAPDGLAPADFRTADGGNLLLHSEIKSILKTSRSSQLLMMVDACHAGGSESAFYIGAVSDLMNGYLNSGISLLLSSDIKQSSLEYPEVGLSYFTHYLLQGIEQGYANKNGDNLITINEAYEYVRLNVNVLTQGQQTPQKGGDFDPSIIMRMN